MDHAVWNTLHDGLIESIGGTVLGDVHVHVGIAYLCEKLPTAADYVVVHLRGCRQFEYLPFHGAVVAADLGRIAAAKPEVLSAEVVDGYVSVACAEGFLKLVYERADVSLAEGQAISQAALEAAADRYWTEREENAKRPRR